MASLTFELKMTCDNDAFHPMASDETARILTGVACDVRNGHSEGFLRDSNGDRVGSWKFED